MEKSELNRLIFRRQFILVNKDIEVDPSWSKTVLKNQDSFSLWAHPDLDVVISRNEKFELVLIGYILDPFSPSGTSQDILDRLSGNTSFTGILNDISSLGGRFAIIFNDGQSVYLLNDATAFREIYYTRQKGAIACGSTPDILAKHLSIEKETDGKIAGFFASPELNKRERIWMGTGTIYKDIFHLLPNHYLDLLKNKVIRFWPYEERKIKKLGEAAELMSKILTGTFDAAASRFNLIQGLTSGWDTKLLLAAAKDHVGEIKFYFNRGFKNDTSEEKVSVDYEVAKQIAQKYQLELEAVVVQQNNVNKDFEEIYYGNNILNRPKLLGIYYDAYERGLGKYVTVSGTMGNEILRLLSGITRKLDEPVKIARLIRYDKYPYVTESLKDWVDEVSFYKDMNHVIIDLFYWEQFFGNWGNLSGTEQDIVREELRPFNNRLFLSTYTSLKDKFRYRDYPIGHVEMIRLLWKDLLNFHMDIPNYRSKILLRTLGLEQFADRTYHRFKTLRQV